MPYEDKEKQNAARRRYYASHKQEVIDRAAAAREIRRQRVREIKEASACVDCDVLYPFYVMQFDHTGDDKVLHISRLVNMSSSWTKIETEIAKCDLVCANCHAVRTWERMGNNHGAWRV